MTNAQTEARAIVDKAVEMSDNDIEDITFTHIVAGIATALAARDAELAEARKDHDWMRDNRNKWQDATTRERNRAERTEAQLTEANKALDTAVEIVRRHVPNIPHDGPVDFEQQAAYEAVGFALHELELHVRRTLAGRAARVEVKALARALCAEDGYTWDGSGFQDAYRGESLEDMQKGYEEKAGRILSALTTEPAAPEGELPYICDACTKGDGGTCRCYPAPEGRQEAVAWLWYGESDGETHLSFGRWQKHPCQYRYKLADIQPTEHDHPTRPAEQAVTEPEKLIAEIEERFPNWRSYRDIIDCIDVTLADLRRFAR